MADEIPAATIHRLQNKITIVLGFCDILVSDMAEDDARRHDLLTIHTAAQEALEILKECQPDMLPE